MIRVDLLGGRRLGSRLARHPLASGFLTFVLVILATVGFFRLLRTPTPAPPPEVIASLEKGESRTAGAGTEGPAVTDQGQAVPSSSHFRMADPDTIKGGVVVPDVARDGQAGQPTSSTPEAAAADTGRRELSLISLMARMEEILPPLVWLSSLRADSDGEYTLEGFAFSSQRAREFVARLSSMSTLCGTPGPITAEDDSYGRPVYHFTVCGTTGRAGSVARLDREVITEKEFSSLSDQLVSEGKHNGLSFPGPIVWEERRGSEKRGSLQASGGYDQMIAWLLALEARGAGRYLTSFSVSPAPGQGSSESTVFSGTIDVSVQ